MVIIGANSMMISNATLEINARVQALPWLMLTVVEIVTSTQNILLLVIIIIIIHVLLEVLLIWRNSISETHFIRRFFITTIDAISELNLR